MKLGRITDLGLDRIEKHGNGVMIYYKDGTRDSWTRFYLVKLSK